MLVLPFSIFHSKDSFLLRLLLAIVPLKPLKERPPMALIVQKYGGTSVGSIDRIKNVASRIKAEREKGHQVVAVISAMGGETDKLIALASELSPQSPIGARA